MCGVAREVLGRLESEFCHAGASLTRAAGEDHTRRPTHLVTQLTAQEILVVPADLLRRRANAGGHCNESATGRIEQRPEGSQRRGTGNKSSIEGLATCT